MIIYQWKIKTSKDFLLAFNSDCWQNNSKGYERIFMIFFWECRYVLDYHLDPGMFLILYLCEIRPVSSYVLTTPQYLNRLTETLTMVCVTYQSWLRIQAHFWIPRTRTVKMMESVKISTLWGNKWRYRHAANTRTSKLWMGSLSLVVMELQEKTTVLEM